MVTPGDIFAGLLLAVRVYSIGATAWHAWKLRKDVPMLNDTFGLSTLQAELSQDEGQKLKLYLDTRGIATIGIGRNLEANGIRPDEMRLMFSNDVAEAVAQLDAHAPWWRQLDAVRQRAMINLTFNMGWPTLSQFTHFLAAMQAHSFAEAEAQLRDSKWWGEVGGRALRIATMISKGVRALPGALPGPA